MIEYQIGSITIFIPNDHRLPVYQSTHPRYDRFLPHLAKFLQKNDVVVDVGANVGDTLAGLFDTNKHLEFVCIEADDTYFGYLETNIAAIRKAGYDLKVTTISAFVGKALVSAAIERGGGTARASITQQGTVRSRTLDDLLDQAQVGRIRLLKTDVDGWDYDVIDSASRLIRNNRPLIYFELQYDNVQQYGGYLDTINRLEATGYCCWCVFDNFGSLMLQTNDARNIRQLMDYVKIQNQGVATRTIYYMDILACCGADEELATKVVDSY